MQFDGDERKASEEYRKAIELDPRQGPAYANLGATWQSVEWAPWIGIEYLNKSIEFDPDNLAAYLLRGHATFNWKRTARPSRTLSWRSNGNEPADARPCSAGDWRKRA